MWWHPSVVSLSFRTGLTLGPKTDQQVYSFSLLNEWLGVGTFLTLPFDNNIASCDYPVINVWPTTPTLGSVFDLKLMSTMPSTSVLFLFDSLSDALSYLNME